MMSKIKSRRITHVKILVGIVLAASLIAVFACEQKKPVSLTPNPDGTTKTVLIDGNKVQISGDEAGVEKIMNTIAESDNYNLKTDPASGQVTLLPKNNQVEGVSVVGYGNSGTPPPPPPPPAGTLLSSEKDVFVIVEEMPEFPGGILELRKFIARSVKYPLEAQKKGIQGKVYVSFVVEKDGSVGAMKVARGVDPSLDQEALRVVGLLPKWTPGKQKGEAVAVRYTVPISFKLE